VAFTHLRKCSGGDFELTCCSPPLSVGTVMIVAVVDDAAASFLTTGDAAAAVVLLPAAAAAYLESPRPAHRVNI
jgi:hypothetical protein